MDFTGGTPAFGPTCASTCRVYSSGVGPVYAYIYSWAALGLSSGLLLFGLVGVRYGMAQSVRCLRQSQGLVTVQISRLCFLLLGYFVTRRRKRAAGLVFWVLLSRPAQRLWRASAPPPQGAYAASKWERKKKKKKNLAQVAMRVDPETCVSAAPEFFGLALPSALASL